MKKYYIRRGDFGNQYTLRWAEEGNYKGDDGEIHTPEYYGYERITRKEAIEFCRAEVWRQEWNPAFAGYADTRIHPLWYRDKMAIDGGYQLDEGCKYIIEASEIKRTLYMI